MIATHADVHFTSASEALVFALNAAIQADYPRPVMNKLAAPSTSTGHGLAGLDAAAQAGMVRAEIKQLGPLAEAVLFARYAPRGIPCACRAACCAGQKRNPEWINAISFLADYVRTTALAGCVTNGMMRQEYVVRYFSAKGRISLEDLAEKHGIVINTVTAHIWKVSKALRTFEHAANEAAEERLRFVGIVVEKS